MTDISTEEKKIHGSNPPERVLITGGRELGGLASVAEALATGFRQLGLPTEIMAAGKIWSRWKDLRSPRVLKILSTSAVFSTPFARRTIAIAHGLPTAIYQGWPALVGIIASYKIANISSGTQLVSVSHYTSANLHSSYNVRTDGVIINPLKDVYLETFQKENPERQYITFAGRLVSTKNIDRLLPAVSELLDENPRLKAAILGSGPDKERLQKMVEGDSRFEFHSGLSDVALRDYLRKTQLFLSGHPTEGLGVVYLEALSQGCAVGMPAAGGGIEIALDQVGTRVHLLPLSFRLEEMMPVLRNALVSPCPPISLDNFTPRAVAEAYLAIDARFSPVTGRFVPPTNA